MFHFVRFLHLVLALIAFGYSNNAKLKIKKLTYELGKSKIWTSGKTR